MKLDTCPELLTTFKCSHKYYIAKKEAKRAAEVDISAHYSQKYVIKGFLRRMWGPSYVWCYWWMAAWKYC